MHTGFALLLVRPLGSPPGASWITTPAKTLPLVPGPGAAGAPETPQRLNQALVQTTASTFYVTPPLPSSNIPDISFIKEFASIHQGMDGTETTSPQLTPKTLVPAPPAPTPAAGRSTDTKPHGAEPTSLALLAHPGGARGLGRANAAPSHPAPRAPPRTAQP